MDLQASRDRYPYTCASADFARFRPWESGKWGLIMRDARVVSAILAGVNKQGISALPGEYGEAER
jgi:hypothetical protein